MPPVIARRRRHIVNRCALTLAVLGIVLSCQPWRSTWDASSTASVATTTRRAIARLSLDPIEHDTVEELSALLATAEELEAETRTRHLWARKEAHRQHAWSSVEKATAEAFNDFRQRRLRERQRWIEAESSTDSALRAAESMIPVGAASSRDQSRALEEARLQLEVARKLALAGNFREAAARAEGSVAAIRTADESHERFLERFTDPANLRLWRLWTETTSAEASRNHQRWILVDKLQHRLIAFDGPRPVAEYEIEIGSHGLARKLHAGDRATPEGRYRVVMKKSRGETRYHKALLIDYPNREDLDRWQRARRDGKLPTGAAAGGLIEIHGNGGRGVDWTDGCIALTDTAMDRLYALAEVGTPVVIVGTVEDSWGHLSLSTAGRGDSE
jgi:hypothetical protein